MKNQIVENVNSKINILFIYDYFYPSFKAGGIIQSLYNLFLSLDGDFNLKVICGNHDLYGDSIDQKRKIKKINYIKKTQILKTLYKESRNRIDYVYLNGLYSPIFFLIPLIFFNCFFSDVRIVIAPRGMLQSGALEIRSNKKKIFLSILKFLGFFNSVIWHATDSQEMEDIKRVIGQKSLVHLAYNIPKRPIQFILPIKKELNHLKLVFLSLITEKKNLGLLLESLKHIQFNVDLDIYGPVKDLEYWQQCKIIISQLPFHIKVRYMGATEPNYVQSIIQKYHALVLPSKGENFGHSIYEALSVGRPVIISKNTPWVNLEDKNSGWNVGLDSNQISQAINELNIMPEANFLNYCGGAHGLALKYFEKSTSLINYYEIFIKKNVI